MPTFAVFESLSASSPEGVLLDLAAVLILLCAFACLGSKLFDRYVIYYGAQSIVLSFAAAVVALHQQDAGLWVLAALTFAIKGIGIPYGTRHFLIDRFELKRDVSLSTGLSSSLIFGAFLTAFAFLAIRAGTVPNGLVAEAALPISTAVILLGAPPMVVRRHTIAQLIGWLIIENGVFLGAIATVATFPFIVEAGVFLDLVAAVLHHDRIRIRAGPPAGRGEHTRAEAAERMIALALIVGAPAAARARRAVHGPSAAARCAGGCVRGGDAGGGDRARYRCGRRASGAGSQRVPRSRPPQRLLPGHDRVGDRAGQHGVGGVPAGRGRAARAAPAPGAPVLHLLRNLRGDDAGLIRDRQPRAAVGADRGQHASQLRAGRPGGQPISSRRRGNTSSSARSA